MRDQADAYKHTLDAQIREARALRSLADYQQKTDLIREDQLQNYRPSTEMMRHGTNLRYLQTSVHKGPLQTALENDMLDKTFDGFELPDGQTRGGALLDMVRTYREQGDEQRREAILCQYQIYAYAARHGIPVEKLATPHNDRTEEPELYDLGACALEHVDADGRSLRIHAQSSVFGCGAASALTALESVRPDLVQATNPLQQYELYRRANAGFMGEGMPGCSPFGLARGVREMGGKVEVWANGRSYFEGWTPGERGEIADRLQDFDEFHCRQMGVPIREGGYDISDVRQALAEGASVQVLRGYSEPGHEDMRHWVTVLGVDDERQVVRVGDPWVEGVTLEDKYDSALQEIPFDDFRQIIRHNGDAQAQAALIYRPEPALPIAPRLHDPNAPERGDDALYAATQSFTTGPAAVLTAASMADPSFRPSQNLELDLWRRSTMIHSGTELAHSDPVALGRAAKTMGMDVEMVHQNLDNIVFGHDQMPDADKRDLQVLLRKMDSIEAEIDGLQTQEITRRVQLDSGYIRREMQNRDYTPVVMLGRNADGTPAPYGRYVVVKEVTDDSVSCYDVGPQTPGLQTISRADFDDLMGIGEDARARAVIFLSKSRR
jgi:hypothetical protein